MADDIFPNSAPYPRASLGFDGADFRVARSHTDGTRYVRGENQLFCYGASYYERFVAVAAAGVSDTLAFSVVVPGEVWVITACVAYDVTTAITSIEFEDYDGANGYTFTRRLVAVASSPLVFSGHVFIRPGNRVRVIFTGTVAADALYAYIHGYRMTLD